MKNSLKNSFPLNGKKAYGLDYSENPFPLPGMKHSLKNTFQPYRKTASSAKKIETFSTSRKIFFC